MQRGHVEEEEQPGDRGALGGTDADRGWGSCGPMKN